MRHNHLAHINNVHQAIEVECISDSNEMEKTRERWDSLLAKTAIQVPYVMYLWFLAALKTIDKDKKPLLVFFKIGGEDIGLIPLVARKQIFLKSKCWHISFIQNPYTPYQAIIYKHSYDSILATLIHFLKANFGTMFVLDLDEMRLRRSEKETILNLARNKLFLLHEEPKSGSRYLPLTQSFDQTLSGLKKKTQKEFRRKIKRLSKLGEITLTRITDEHEIHRNLELFFSFYARTWKGAEPHPEFYHRVCSEFNYLNKLYFYSLMINGEAIAYLICIASDGIMYGIKTTYNPSYYAFSPGVVLFYKAIEHMSAIPGIKEFDIGRGHEQFKREWTSMVHQHFRLLIYPYAPYWRAFNYARYQLLPRIRKHDSLERLYMMLRHAPRAPTKLADTQPTRSERPKVRTIRPAEHQRVKPPSQYTIRFASASDLDGLVVAMAARNFKAVQDRLKNERCILIFYENRIIAYFWLSPESSVDRQKYPETGSQSVFIDEWSISDTAIRETPEEKFIQMLAGFISSSIPSTDSIMLTIRPSLCTPN